MLLTTDKYAREINKVALPGGKVRYTATQDGKVVLTLDRSADASDAAIIQTIEGMKTGLDPLPQGDGSLGERMRRACVRVLSDYPAVVLVGSDCPGYDAGYLGMACRLLEEGTPAVLGPAIDGGYVLIGLRAFRRLEF